METAASVQKVKLYPEKASSTKLDTKAFRDKIAKIEKNNKKIIEETGVDKTNMKIIFGY
jgi:hypothetical protein